MMATELRDLSDEELAQKLEEAKEELFKLRFRLVTGQLDNPMLLKSTRREVARIMTVMREREIAYHEAGGPAVAEEA